MYFHKLIYKLNKQLMKVSSSFSKFSLIILLFAFSYNNKTYSLSENSKNDLLNKFDKLKEIKGLKNKHDYYYKFITYSEVEKVIPIEKRIEYFEYIKEENKNDKDIYFIDIILISLYQINNQIDKAIRFGLESYFNNRNIIDNDKLCQLLIIIENCYSTAVNNTGIIYISKEKLKRCHYSGQILFHNIYYKMGLYDQALKAYKKYCKFGTKAFADNETFSIAKHYNNFGVYQMYDEKIDSALINYKTSLKLLKLQKEEDINYKTKEIDFWMGLVNGNIASCYLKQKKYKEAIPLFLNEIKESEILYSSENFLGSDKVWEELALCYIMTSQPKKASYYINKLKKNKTRYFKLKSEYFSKFYSKDSSIYYNKKHLFISDSIYKNNSKKDKTELLNFFSFEDDLISNKYQIQVLEEKESNSSFKVKALSLLAILIFIFLLITIYFYMNKNKAQKIILNQKNNLELTLNKNKILLKELNHRVKNNLQMISSVLSLQSSKIKEKESKKHFTAAANRIKVLSEIHNSFYNKNQLNETDLFNYVSTLKDYLISSIINPEIKVEFNIDIKPNIYINSDNKTTLGLIINELITNSFKYAFTKNSQNLISISIIKKDETYYFSYSDNGKGFNNGEIDKTKSIGLKLILRLVNQLGDEASISSTNGMNIKFKFSNNIDFS